MKMELSTFFNTTIQLTQGGKRWPPCAGFWWFFLSCERWKTATFFPPTVLAVCGLSLLLPGDHRGWGKLLLLSFWGGGSRTCVTLSTLCLLPLLHQQVVLLSLFLFSHSLSSCHLLFLHLLLLLFFYHHLLSSLLQLLLLDDFWPLHNH